MCTHRPRCPDADAIDWFAARNVAAHPEQGWTLLCNGVVVFDDLGALLPDGRVTTRLRTGATASPQSHRVREQFLAARAETDVPLTVSVLVGRRGAGSARSPIAAAA